MGDDKPEALRLTKHFQAVAKIDLHNWEVAALIGFVDESNPNILLNGRIGKYRFAGAKIEMLEKKKRDKRLLSIFSFENLFVKLLNT